MRLDDDQLTAADLEAIAISNWLHAWASPSDAKEWRSLLYSVYLDERARAVRRVCRGDGPDWSECIRLATVLHAVDEDLSPRLVRGW